MSAMVLILALYPVVASLAIHYTAFTGDGLRLTDCFYFSIATMFTIGFGDILYVEAGCS